ncbi:MAG TPA: DUF190 domain-containing protein [Crinalium sp.]|jgi:hypothetical protein
MRTLERLTIYVGESDHWQGKPVYLALVEEARRRGLAGATALRGVAGFGNHQQLHTTRILELSSDLPMMIVVMDSAEAIASFLPTVRDMVTGGIVIQETVNVVHQAPLLHAAS